MHLLAHACLGTSYTVHFISLQRHISSYMAWHKLHSAFDYIARNSCGHKLCKKIIPNFWVAFQFDLFEVYSAP